jgi:hypothetical protein
MNCLKVSLLLTANVVWGESEVALIMIKEKKG